jgi:hypothetical protein
MNPIVDASETIAKTRIFAGFPPKDRFGKVFARSRASPASVESHATNARSRGREPMVKLR